MTRAEALRLLGLDEDATEADIKLAYREMAQILHPDKYADNRKLSERATEQFKHVNEARDLLLGAKGARRGSRRAGASAGAKGGPSGGSSRGGRTAPTDPRDRATSLKARLAGIAAARVQLTAQLDAELDRRRLGIYFTIGGIIAVVVGMRIRVIAPIGGLALVWGIVQLFTSQAQVKIIRGHLASLAKDRTKCEEELENL
jgi:hypothetical protein